MMVNKPPLPLTDPRNAVLRPTVLYTDVDGHCDKLVTETVTSFETTNRSRDMVGAYQI